MKHLRKFNESLNPDEDLLLNNLYNFYVKKFDKEGEDKFLDKAKEMVKDGEILQSSLDEFCHEKELDKDSLEFDKKTHKLIKKTAVTKRRKKPTSTSDGGYYTDGCGTGGGYVSSPCGGGYTRSSC